MSYDSNPGTVKAALDSIRDYSHLPATITSPSWIGDAPPGLSPVDILACRSTLLHLPTMQHYPATPRFFSVNALDFDPDPAAPIPSAWFQFLHQLFDDDIESHNLLQEWFGYSLTGDTSQQKMLLVVGPKRSGKGTIARILTCLVGIRNYSGPTISALAGPFGMQPLIGKSIAIVSDARFHGEGITQVIERLLCISGEDTLTIDRKHMTSVTMKLPTRFVFLTNEFPRLHDASGALAGRFVILRLTESFYCREDRRTRAGGRSNTMATVVTVRDSSGGNWSSWCSVRSHIRTRRMLRGPELSVSNRNAARCSIQFVLADRKRENDTYSHTFQRNHPENRSASGCRSLNRVVRGRRGENGGGRRDSGHCPVRGTERTPGED